MLTEPTPEQLDAFCAVVDAPLTTSAGPTPEALAATTVFIGAMTDALAASISDGRRTNDTALIRAGVAEIVRRGNGATVDSHRIADALVAMRDGTDLVTDPHQVLTYAQHILRETPEHVCRHSVGDGFYRVHVDEVCSPECATKWGYTTPTKQVAVASSSCESCYMTIPAGTDCPNCD